MKFSRIYSGLLILCIICAASCKEKKSDGPNPTPTPPANEVFMTGNKFVPSTITVTAGTTVKWTNKEAVIHTVTSDNGVFNSVDLGMNQEFSFKFTTVGTYPYHCIHHLGMNGAVIVQ